MAKRIAQVPPELAQMNKRLVHRQMDAMGMRAGLRAGTELCALGTHTQAMADFLKARVEKGGLTGALQDRDAKFGDYRTSHEGAEETASKGTAARASTARTAPRPDPAPFLRPEGREIGSTVTQERRREGET